MSGIVTQFPLEKEYEKQTGITPQDISKLREWLLTQPHLPGDHITDLDLILAYHSCERSTEVTKQVLDLHYTLRTLIATFFKDRAFDASIEATVNTVIMKPLPTRTKEGYAVLYTHYLDVNVSKFNFADNLKTMIMTLDLWQFEEGTWPGMMLVSNLEGMTLGHMAKLDLGILQQFVYYVQETMLIKMKGFHILNAPSFMDTLLTMVRPFTKSSLLDLVHLHRPGSTTIEEFYPIDALPKEAGGNYKSLEECRVELLAKLRGSQEFFLQENCKRVVEARRAGKPKTISDIFGVEGSFKKLDID